MNRVLNLILIHLKPSLFPKWITS